MLNFTRPGTEVSLRRLAGFDMQLTAVIVALTALSQVLPAPASERVIPASEARRENFQVNKRMQWHNNLDEAREEAAKSGRLVFWVHMLGSMDGKT